MVLDSAHILFFLAMVAVFAAVDDKIDPIVLILGGTVAYCALF